jgi:uncharacterized protein YjiS (DUF1127 family)
LRASDRTTQAADLFASTIRMLRTWRERYRQRLELSIMSERDLADLGVSRNQAAWETDKWFWRDWSPQWSDKHGK